MQQNTTQSLIPPERSPLAIGFHHPPLFSVVYRVQYSSLFHTAYHLCRHNIPVLSIIIIIPQPPTPPPSPQYPTPTEGYPPVHYNISILPESTVHSFPKFPTSARAKIPPTNPKPPFFFLSPLSLLNFSYNLAPSSPTQPHLQPPPRPAPSTIKRSGPTIYPPLHHRSPHSTFPILLQPFRSQPSSPPPRATTPPPLFHPSPSPPRPLSGLLPTSPPPTSHLLPRPISCTSPPHTCTIPPRRKLFPSHSQPLTRLPYLVPLCVTVLPDFDPSCL